MTLQAREYYLLKSEEYSTTLKSVKHRLKQLAWVRLTAFLLVFVPFFVFKNSSFLTFGIALFFLVSFLFLIKINLKLERKKLKLEALLKICSNELLANGHIFTPFYDGKEFADVNHNFAYDLDLFGEGSLFQFLNRTVTITGRKSLANLLMFPPMDSAEIKKRQEAVREIASLREWRLKFLAAGMLFEENADMGNQMKNWSELNLELPKIKLLKLLTWILPVLAVLAAVPALMGITNLLLVLVILIQWFVTGINLKKISEFYSFFGQKTELLGKYIELLNSIENQKFNSEYIIRLQEKAKKPKAAGLIFNQLKKILKEFEYRQNILVGLVLNSLFLWDIRSVCRLYNWHSKNRLHLVGWLDMIAETDTLTSLGNYSDNYPEFVFPTLHEGGFCLSATNLGHPLLPVAKRVCNSLEINGWGKVVIITGANMAGKSTFLRTIGVNLILGRIGAPVCASKMVFTPVDLYTNMRTTDSLFKDESYFFAELKRIKGVLDRLKNGERIFVILDEMLKGTNSEDKYNGSKHLIGKLIEYKAVALIATHDLKLSELENEYPQLIYNKCFEIRIIDNEMVFDYLLNDGATKTMNATFLMRKMGII